MRKRERSQQQLAAALEHSPDAVVIVDADGVILVVNAQTELLFGYERSELVGQPVEHLVPERLAATHLSHRQTFLQAPHVRLMGVGLELTGRRKDGGEFPVHISLGPLELAGRQLVIATVRDISERLRAQEEARQLVDLRRRRGEAIELNDSVVQHLAVARLALDLGQPERAARVIDHALAATQAIVAELLSERLGDGTPTISPGDLVRSAPAAGPEST
jgi:PAS domain S-box-containing protein